MAIGCGTLSKTLSRHEFRCASANGRQHSLPRDVHHGRVCQKQIGQMWPSKESQGLFVSYLEKPTRPWGVGNRNRYGGEGVEDSTAEGWLTGDFWNTDSNIRLMTPHECRREAAKTAHDVHRHDMITKLKMPGSERVSDSGVLTADSCFLEAWGFDLGLRDRAARPVPCWRPPTRELEFGIRIRNCSRPASRPGSRSQKVDPDQQENMEAPRWDGFEHFVKREGARRSQNIHTHSDMNHPGGIPHDKVELRPSAIYTKKWQKYGESAFREHGKKEPLDRSRIALAGTWRYDRERSRMSTGSEDFGTSPNSTREVQ